MDAKINDGGPAFPSEFYETEHGDRVLPFAGTRGMSLRDYIAAQAMMGSFVLGKATGNTFEAIAADAYKQADAMLAERAKGGA